MTLRIGIVGAGANTRLRHIPGFQAIDGVEVVAVCNRSLESSARVAGEFDIAKVFGDWKELVHSEEVDAVCVGTWPYMHCPVTLEALACGKHVLTEARMAMNLSEARQMLDAARVTDKVAMVVPAPFFLEAEVVLIDRLRQGEFGDCLEVHVRSLAGRFDPSAALHWRQRRDYSGNNILMLGILNETVRRYVGDEVSVLAKGQIFTRERLDRETGQQRTVDVPDSLGVIAAMKNGADAVYHLSSVSHLGGGESIEIYCTKGTIKLAADGAWIASEKDDELRHLTIPREKRGGWRVEQDFVESVRDGKPVTQTSFADGVKYMEFTEAVNRSMHEGRRIELPLG